MSDTLDHPVLDQDELLHLAIHASANGRHGGSILYLKDATTRADASGAAHFMLGSEYARIGMYQHAIAHMQGALEIDPTLAIARLQLGLLWLTLADGPRCREACAPLLEMGADEPLRLFGQGLIHLIDDQFGDMLACMERGMALNQGNAPLNADMQRLVDRVHQMLAAQAEAAAAPGDEPEQAPSLLMSAYEQA